LNTTWRSIAKADIYKGWSGGLIEGLLFRTSVFNNEPERDTLKKLVNKPLHRKIVVGTTDANTGEYMIFTEEDILLNKTLQVESIMFSSAIPLVFPY